VAVGVAERSDAIAAGRYRISLVTPEGREAGEPFDVAGPAPASKPKPTRGGLRKHPGPWHMHGTGRYVEPSTPGIIRP
jgi:hypothetical protein